MVDALTQHMDRVAAALKGHRFRFNTELDLQAGIARVLVAAGEDAAAEVRLSARDRIDFLVAPGIGIEVKVKGSDEGVHMQLLRYAEHARVQGLLLVSGTGRIRDIPPTIEGKPVRVVLLQRVLF